MKSLSTKTKGSILSVFIFIFCLFLWHVATVPKASKIAAAATASAANSAEYNSLMGGNAMDGA